jgi:hypothetical protein
MTRLEAGFDLPSGNADVWYYPGPTRDGLGEFGSMLRVEKSSGEHWFACCQKGIVGESCHFEFDDNTFVVISGGAGYRIAYDDAQDWNELPLSPQIRAARHIPQHKMVLTFDWTDAAAYGTAGKLWSSPRLFLDDLEVVDIDEYEIRLRGAVPGGSTEVILNLSDGAVASGTPYDWSSHAS